MPDEPPPDSDTPRDRGESTPPGEGTPPREEPTPEKNPPLDTTQLTWAALLSHWVDFARSALALPDHAAGRRMRQSVPDLIALQALWFALEHLHELAPDEQRLGLDRAEVQIERHARSLHERWPNAELPEGCRELIDDARHALTRARAADEP